MREAKGNSIDVWKRIQHASVLTCFGVLEPMPWRRSGTGNWTAQNSRLNMIGYGVSCGSTLRSSTKANEPFLDNFPHVWTSKLHQPSSSSPLHAIAIRCNCFSFRSRHTPTPHKMFRNALRQSTRVVGALSASSRVAVRNAAPTVSALQSRTYAEAKASPTEVSSILEQRIRGVQEESNLAETGRVLSVGYVAIRVGKSLAANRGSFASTQSSTTTKTHQLSCG
ncbi:hypothetical protein QBC34DRAFT_186256 [Podospora aff. communis PSN243]|uniref:Uncharacterized protein n=1 Tax=Podospora aff. communis PSN243 TaxID=3040156 RepID=A0AAV9GB06_9PEZI|nr:hypothetical protein QBC34DRAFT_186256 [Podospora aff. communis PSN243]